MNSLDKKILEGYDWYNYLYSHKDLHKLEYFDESKLYRLSLRRKDYDNNHFNLKYYNQEYNLKFKDKKSAINHFLNEGLEKGYNYNPGKNYTLKIILPTKNEIFLIDKWIQYYSKMVGFQNIIILDQGSKEEIWNIYRKYPDLMVISVNRYFDVAFNYKPFNNMVKFLTKYCKYITKLDTDEFLCNYRIVDKNLILWNNVIEMLNNSENYYLGSFWFVNDGSEAVIYSDNFDDYLYFNLKQIRDSIINFQSPNWLYGKKLVKNKTCNAKKLMAGNHNIKYPFNEMNLLTFHLTNKNIKNRIESNIDILKDSNYIDDDNIEACINQLYHKKTPFHYHKVTECYHFFKNKKTLNNKPNLNRNPNANKINFINDYINNKKCKRIIKL